MGGWGTNQYMGTPWNPWMQKRHTRWVEQRLGCGGGGPPGTLCHRHGYRRLGAAAGLVVRHCRPEDDGRPDQQPWNFAACPDARYARADDALGRRRGAALQFVPRLRSTRPAHGIPAARRSDAIAQAWRRWLASCRPSRSGTGRYRSGGTGGLRHLDRAVRGLGARIIEIALPCKFGDFAALTGQVIGAEGYAILGDFVDQLDPPIDEAVRPRIWIGKSMSARDYLGALAKREKLKQQFDGASATLMRC